MQAGVADRYDDVGLTATALTFALRGNRRYIGAISPAYMRLKCRVVNGGGGRRDSTITSRCAKGIEAGVFAAQERRSACATLDGVDKRIEAFTRHARLGRLLERGRGTSRRGRGGSE